MKFNIKSFLHKNYKIIKHKITSFFYKVLFAFNQPKKKTVLLIEGNNCHTELFPSFVQYLKKINYNVEAAVLPSQFGFLPKLNVSKVYFLTFRDMLKILRSKKIKKYDFVFFTSYRLYMKNSKGVAPSKIFDFINPLDIKSKFGTILTVHHKEDIDDTVKNSKGAVVLSKNLREGENIYVLNPCFFKEISSKNKNKKVKFITTGKLEIFRKNPELIIEGAIELKKAGIENFEIVIAGQNKDFEIPSSLKDCVKNKGCLSFEKLYLELQSSDFYLPLLDFEIKEHKRYIEAGTSGSFQLIRGFLLPPVIEKPFAYANKFTKEDSIVYMGKADFIEALKRAVFMDNEEYRALQAGLLRQKLEIEEESVQNLKNLLENYV